MDVFGLYALAGALAGFIVGDLQREWRFREIRRRYESLANLARSTSGPVADAVANGHINLNGSPADGDTGSDRHRDRDTLRAVPDRGDGQARRRAVSRANSRAGAVRSVPVRAPRGEHAAALKVAGYDCG